MDMSQLLPMLMSPENGLRVQAESAYKSQCDASPDVMASQLSECLAHHEVCLYSSSNQMNVYLSCIE